MAAVDGIRLGGVQIQAPPLTSCDSIVYLLNLPLLQSPDLRNGIDNRIYFLRQA